MNEQHPDRDGFKLDVDQVPDIEESAPNVPQLRRGPILAGVVIVGLGAVVGIGHALWSKQNPAATESSVTLKKPSKVRAAIPDFARDKPEQVAPEPVLPADSAEWSPKTPITLTSGQAAATRGETVNPCLSDDLTPQQAVDCEAKGEGGGSKLLAGAEQSDRNVAAHRHGGTGYQPGSDYAANTQPAQSSKRLREDENGDEGNDDDYLPARPKRQERTEHPEPLAPPPASLGGLSGLQGALAGAQQGQAALQALANQGMDHDDRAEAFNHAGGVETLDGDEDDIGECEIGAGDPLHGNLLVAINSDVPGQNTVRLEVNQTVYCGGDHQHVAIPQGSTLVGSFNARVGYGDERIQLAFKQLRRPPSAGHPNGTKVAINAVGADLVGAIGIPADVNNHWSQVITGSLLSALLGMGPSAVAGSQTGFAPNIGQQAAAAVGTNLNQAGQRVVQRELARKPTLETKILEGATVILTASLPLEPWMPRKVKGLPRRKITWVTR